VLREGNSYNARAYLGEWEGRGERENAEIRRRPLDISLNIPITGRETLEFTITNSLMFPLFKTYNFQHEQIFFEDKEGGNVGFFGDSQVRPDTLENIFKYKPKNNTKYDDKIMRKAIDRVAPQTKSYNFLMNNCQDFIQRVIQEYHTLSKEK
ncbi:hypothetical protein, partial [Helicobacter cholecystus]|uniref:hypothetical protein n=1 Tax=Helicobacter cholecystus TaxID=45498 RepID=UPI002739095C